jgi:hypothetical protein
MWEPLSSAATWGVQRWSLVDEGLQVGHGQQPVAVLRTAPTFKAPTLEFATHPLIFKARNRDARIVLRLERARFREGLSW